MTSPVKTELTMYQESQSQMLTELLIQEFNKAAGYKVPCDRQMVLSAARALVQAGKVELKP